MYDKLPQEGDEAHVQSAGLLENVFWMFPLEGQHMSLEPFVVRPKQTDEQHEYENAHTEQL